jgi:prepilin-type N-terminal cleavage/methylation domain-containing protein
MKFSHPPTRGGFTMIEIAICLAIIGFALVAIIGVLPYGMNTQRDNREETVINQDATVLLEAIRSGARGADYLTNFVYAVTNNWQAFNSDGTPYGSPGVDGYTYNGASVNNFYRLTNGVNIIGVLSTPEFIAGGKAISSPFNVACTSNHIIAYVRSISGLAAEKPPQDNSIMRDDTFTYRVYCVNAPVAVDTNTFNSTLKSSLMTQLAANLRELRLTFLWPQLPNGNVGNGRQTFRASVAGQLAADANGLFFYRSEFFTNAP